MSKIALITGAAGGLGRAVTERLRAQSWQLALVSREAERLRDVPSDALAIVADCATAEGAAQAVAACTERFGRPPDALAHCAGSVLLAALHRTTAEQYREVVRANLDSAFFTLGAFVKGCLDARQAGAAVLVSSVVARIGVVNHEAIAAAKAGVEGLTRSAAATYSSKGLRVNAIAPGSCARRPPSACSQGPLRSRGSPRSTRSVATARSRTWRAPSPGCSRTMPNGSPGRSSRWTAGSPPCGRWSGQERRLNDARARHDVLRRRLPALPA